jgi:SAM-dependent methyltransferase
VDDLLRATARAEERHFWFRGFRWFVRPLIHRALAHKRSPRVLDCGCGTCTNLHLLAPYGAAYGFDLSTVGLQMGRERGCTGVVRASVAAVPFASAVFDLVTSFDVLYALDERTERAAVADVPHHAPEATRSSTSPPCRCFGAITRFSVAKFGGIRGFSPRVDRVRRIRIERLTCHERRVVLPMLGVRLFHRIRGLSAESDAASEIAVPPAVVNGVLSVLLFLESVWLRVGVNPAGGSLLCLARKPEDAVPR